MITSFKKFLMAEEKSVHFTFVSMNPPSVEHANLMSVLAEASSNNAYKIFMSQKCDENLNPLDYATKIKMSRKMFPIHSRNLIMNEGVRNALDAMVELYGGNYQQVTMITGDDRIYEMTALLKKYNGIEGRHGFYHFENIRVEGCGIADPDQSSLDLVEFAQDEDFVKFSRMLPKGVTTPKAQHLFNEIRNRMGLDEVVDFRKDTLVEDVDELREQYVAGNLFNVGDEAVLENTDEVVKIATLGANYVIVETTDGMKMRKWLNQVKPLTE